jgi:hypothetical protein
MKKILAAFSTMAFLLTAPIVMAGHEEAKAKECACKKKDCDCKKGEKECACKKKDCPCKKKAEDAKKDS